MKCVGIAIVLFLVIACTIGSSMGSIDCLQALENCKGTHKCRNAFRGLNEKCKVVAGRCSAKMVDLPRCGQIMDRMFAQGFSETKCICNNENKRCTHVRETIYNNPCFASIRHLRKHNLFPEEITAYDKVSGFEDTTVAMETTNNLRSDKAVETYSDGKFNNKKLDSNPVKEEVGTEQISLNKNKVNKKFDQAEEKNTLSKQKLSKQNTTEKIPQDNLDYTNYKLIAIILAVLLGLFVMATFVFIVYTRLRKQNCYHAGTTKSTNKKEDHSKTSSSNCLCTHRPFSA